MKQKRGATKKDLLRRFPTIGVCGLDCGFCPRYYTAGPSRCPGCGGPDFHSKHPSCSFITCCVKTRNLEICAECPEFPCSKFKTDREYQQVNESSSYPSLKVVMRNLHLVKQQGVKGFVAQQRKRMALLETMIQNFDDGRSKSFFCRVVCLSDLPSVQNALKDALQRIKRDKIEGSDRKTRSTILKEALSRQPVTHRSS
jgi:hypothetical protein